MKKLLSITAVAFLSLTGCEYVASSSGGGHSEHVVTLTDANFLDQVLKSETPVLVDFSATWCGPCKTMEPRINALADEFAGQVVIGKLDIDENQATTRQYDVSGIPAMLIFEDGKEVDRFVGITDKEDIAAKLSSLVNN